MNKFVLISLLCSFILIQGAEGDMSSLRQPLLHSDDEHFDQQQEGVPQNKKQAKKVQFKDESKQDNNDENPGAKIVYSSFSPNKKHREVKKEKAEQAALQLPPLDQLNLGMKLCTLQTDKIHTAHLSPYMVDSIKKCANHLNGLAEDAALSKIVRWMDAQQPGEVPEQGVQARNENQQEKFCCAML
jgi:hypothetical protein